MAQSWRLSASTVLLRRCAKLSSGYDYKVLFLKRGNISLAGMHAFPGGAHELSDKCMKETALRELFEETGVLPGLGSSVTERSIEYWRKELRKDAKQFHHCITDLKIEIDFATLHHFCTFVTPIFEKKRFITPFFLTEVCENSCKFLEADGFETESVNWVDPSEALQMNVQGHMKYLPPQFYIMHELSKHVYLDDVLQCVHTQPPLAHTDDAYSAENIMTKFDVRGYPPMQPEVLKEESDGTKVVLSLPFDEAHVAHKGSDRQRHRMHCPLPMGSGGYELEQNS